MGLIYYNTPADESQEHKLIQKTAIKKRDNEKIIQWLMDIGETERAQNMLNCATWLGITTIEGITKIVRSNFCRERLCNVCSWRRQSKFIAQMLPILNILKEKGYTFLFATLTIKNCTDTELSANIDTLLKGFQLLSKRREVARAWKGICRSLEITYNEFNNTFHPHIHMLIAIDNTYKDNYITQEKLSHLWQECIKTDYIPIVDIRKVKDEDSQIGAVETLKYALKPTTAYQALNAFLYSLKGRRLISFSGIFQKQRKILKYTTLEDPTDDIRQKSTTKYNLYKFDVTGGVYNFYETYDF